MIASVDVVLVACSAKFHPVYLRAAIEAGKHVFVEKPHAIDPVGVRAVTAACELAKQKGLCVQSGLQSRYHKGYQETVKRIHDGAIGDIVTIEENFLRGPYGLYKRQEGMNEVEYQFSNQYHFTWLSGDDVPQSLVHNVDRATWAMNEQVPQKAHGMGGRSASFGEVYGNVFDHHGVVYQYENGVRMYAFCRTQTGCYGESSSLLFGSKGRCNLTQCRIEGETNWRYDDKRGDESPYDIEHRALFAAHPHGQAAQRGRLHGLQHDDRRDGANDLLQRQGNYLGTGDEVELRVSAEARGRAPRYGTAGETGCQRRISGIRPAGNDESCVALAHKAATVGRDQRSRSAAALWFLMRRVATSGRGFMN